MKFLVTSILCPDCPKHEGALLSEHTSASSSNWPTWLALLVAGGSLMWQVVTFFVGREDRERKEKEVAAIRHAQTEALVSIAKATVGSGNSTSDGATLSARLDHGRPDRLIITNRGPGGVLLRSVEVIGQHVLVNPPQERLPVDLLPEESTSIVASMTFENTLPLEVEMHWLDSRGEQKRKQIVNYS